MSLYTICQNAAEGIPINVPTTIYGNSDETATMLLSQANRAGKALARMDWPELQIEYEFTTTIGTADYALPDDFDRMISMTAWNRSQYWRARGGLTPRAWQEIKSSVLGNTIIGTRFRIRRVSGIGFRALSLDPTPTAAEDLVFEYISNQWCASSDLVTYRKAWGADTDVGILDEYLLELGLHWRVLNRLGMSYLEEREEYDREVAKAFAVAGVMEPLELSPSRNIRLLNFRNVPDTHFGS